MPTKVELMCRLYREYGKYGNLVKENNKLKKSLRAKDREIKELEKTISRLVTEKVKRRTKHAPSE